MYKKLLFFIASFCATSVYAQISFQPQEVTSFTASAQGSRMADIDNDGDLDIAIFGSLGVDWYENKFPEEGFAPKRTVAAIPGTNYIKSIDFSDVDGDGDLDIIGSELFQDKLFLCINLDGQGTFAPFQVWKTIDQISFVRHIDMDGDGDKDLFYKRHGSNGSFTGYYENTGLANNYSIHHPGPSEGNRVRLVDFNDDGLPDILFEHETFISWARNNGNGNFSQPAAIPTLNNYLYHVEIGDIDNDGDQDIVAHAVQNYITKLIYKLNDGQGNFAPEVNIRYDIEDVQSLGLGDLDNDNKLDILLSIQTSGNQYFGDVKWLKNAGSNAFTDMPFADVNLRSVTQIQTSDLNNDNVNDIVVLSQFNRVITYLSTGPGTFGSAKNPAAANLEVTSAVSGDVDGDGDLDVVSCSSDDSKIYLYRNEAGVYQNQIIVSHDVSEAKIVAIADMDGDEDLDIISISGPSTSGSEDKISWYENLDGLGNYGPQINIPIGGYDSPDGLAVYDVDADGDVDIVTSLSAWPEDGDRILWYANNGSGGFAAGQLVATGINGVKTIRYEDIDNDGDLDLISASFLDDKVLWFENLNGAGTFGPARIITATAEAVVDVVIADFDSDGDKDVAYMSNNSGANKILWQPNVDGLGNFGTPLVVASNGVYNAASAISSADLDYDGDIDIVIGLADKTVWYENLHGQANFEPGKVVSTSFAGIRSAEIVDGDNDGDLDILVASYSTNSVALFKNQGLSLNTIKGMVRYDIEGNGCGTNDELLQNVLVSATDGSTTLATLTFRDEHAGSYRLYTGEGNFNTSVITNLPAYFQLTPASHNASFTGFGNIDTADFCIEPIGQYNDLSVILYPLEEVRPGFDTSYRLVYKSMGTSALTGQVTIAYNNAKLQFLNSETEPSSQTPGSLVFGFTDLEPLSTREVLLNFNVFAPPTTNIDDHLVFTTTIEPSDDDHIPADNSHTLSQIVIGSYDPNDITCLEGDSVLLEDADQYLHYVVRFQNSGTASAINVRVQHQLDEKLDWTTLQLEGMSHNGRTTITDQSLVEFTFHNIYLPHEAANEPGSHGHIMFKIKPKADEIQEGDTVQATADIFFDFNPPITTNTASTVYASLGVDTVNANNTIVHPNPATDQLAITSIYDILQVNIYNLLGVAVLEAKNKHAIDISSLESGVYLVTVTTESGSFTTKIVKQ